MNRVEPNLTSQAIDFMEQPYFYYLITLSFNKINLEDYGLPSLNLTHYPQI